MAASVPAQSGGKARPVVGLIVHRGGHQFEHHPANRLGRRRVVSLGDDGIGSHVIGGEPSFDGLRWRNRNDRIPLDNRLAGKGVSGLEVVG